ncbi:MAG: hypothetical protein GY847_07250 [Proteobacteria bacterium]|nr:hypothetical protein [Pseudomonadota bacterium]
MKKRDGDKIWFKFGMARREFLRRFGIGAGALTLSPLFIERFEVASAYAQAGLEKVFLVKNGNCFENASKIWEMLGGPSKYIGASDTVVIKGNGQWPNQGYTHTGVIKGVIDEILAIPSYSGEVMICDNVQNYGSSGGFGFDATLSNRTHNWPDHNWNSLAEEYQNAAKPVASKRWYNSDSDIAGPQGGEGWIRDFFSFHDQDSYLSYPIFESPLTAGRLIDMKNGVWEGGGYTGQNVRTIFMPNLNNHGRGSGDYAGVTSAVKSFFGATEIHYGSSDTFRDYRNIHGASYSLRQAEYAGELAARFIQTMYAPVLYITTAMWSGHESRTGNAIETKAVIACENPATLDYVACKDVISPHASYLDPDQDNNTRKQILGCVSGGIGTIDSMEFEVITYDFENPTVSRLDIDKKIKEFKEGSATEQEVKDVINEYMETQ